jgi:hypothetical protein
MAGPPRASCVIPLPLPDRPPRRLCLLAALAVLLSAASAGAQVPVPRPDTTRRDTTRVPRPSVPVDTAPPAARDTAADTTARQPRRSRAALGRPVVRPPISPRRALIYSLLVPGLGQSRLDRSATGAFFVAIEAGALAMVAKSAFDLAEAKAYRGDSLIVTSFPVDSVGEPIGAGTGTQRNQFTASLVRARRLHLEDWLALIAFNHLISGAEAFVSANLWAVPGEVAVTRSRRGPAISMRVPW